MGVIAPNIRGRRTWGAVAPQNRPTYDDWDDNRLTLVTHHTAGAAPTTLNKVKAELRGIQKAHMSGARGEPFNDIGYNYLIDRLGRVWEGRGWGVRGAHTLGHNTNTIGISFMGNHDVTKLNRVQRLSYYRLVRKLQRHGANIVDIKGHREMPGQSTACPGKYGISQLRWINRRLLRSRS